MTCKGANFCKDRHSLPVANHLKHNFGFLEGTSILPKYSEQVLIGYLQQEPDPVDGGRGGLSQNLRTNLSLTFSFFLFSSFSSFLLLSPDNFLRFEQHESTREQNMIIIKSERKRIFNISKHFLPEILLY